MSDEGSCVTRRDLLKLGAMGVLSAGVSGHGASLDGAWLEETPPLSPYGKISHDLSQMHWTLYGSPPFYSNFSNYGQTEGQAEWGKSEVKPMEASVPGSVQAALLKAGLIEDWNIGLNARKCEWIENRDWIYVAAIPDEWLQGGKQVRLRCAGLDYAGDILLNKRKVCSFQNSFVPVLVDLTSALKQSGNVLCIRFAPPPRWLGQIGYTSRIKAWKPRFSYGWDWTSRIVQTGIWDDITLEISHGAEIERLRCSADVDLMAGKGKLKVWGSIRGGSKVRITLKDMRRELRTAELRTEDFSGNDIQWNDLPVDLWWPNRMGTQRLYDLEIELLDSQERLLDRQSRKIGFKNIQWQRTKGAAEPAEPYLCIVNGKPVFLFGANWTPIRPNFADVQEEDYLKRIRIYHDCGMNLLRVWGGGFLEKENFYNLCDEMGLLVWQEFPLSSSGLDNYPPDDPTSIDELAIIAESYIDRRSHHVSLLLWCGGNELQDDENGVKSSQPTLTIRHHPAIVKMGEVVARSDPGRRFLPTNPLGPVGMFTLQECGKGEFWDVHGPWNFDGPPDGEWKTLWTKDDAMFHSEMGAPSASPVSVIRKYKGNLLEIPGSDENPLWARQPLWIDWPKFVLEKGRSPRDLEEFVAWSQARQTAALMIAFRSVRSRFPACGGLVIWMGHDSFPCTANTAVVDFEGNPKPVVAELTKLLGNPWETEG